MKPAARLVLNDILSRAKWVLIVMATLQFIFGLIFFGMTIPHSRYLLLPLMFLGLAPVVAPSRRLLLCLPIARDTIDRFQWLFGGGLIVIVATGTSLLAWLCVTVFPLQSDGLDYINVATLLIGMPGVIGLLMILRRWSTGGSDPNNQDRPLLLGNYFWPPLLMLISTLVQLRELGPVAAVSLVILAIGLGVQGIFLIAPQRYLAWIAKPRVHSDKRQPMTRSPINAIVRQIVWTSLIGGFSAFLLAFLFASLAPNRAPAAELATTIAVIPMFRGLVLLSAIKVFRSLPHSLSRSTLHLMMIFLIPAFVTMAVYLLTNSLFSHGASTLTLMSTLPFIAAIAPFAPLCVRVATQARTRLILFYVAFAAFAAWEGRQIASLASNYILLGNVIAVVIIVASFAWMRRELHIGTTLYRHRTTNAWS